MKTMKKFALIATAAAFTLPSAVQAAQNDNDEVNWFDGESTVSVTINEGYYYDSFPFIPAEEQTATMKLENGNSLMLKGTAAYIVNQNGNAYFAPNGPHTTVSGITYTTEDGEVLYAAPEAKTYLITANVIDRDKDGIPNDVDYSIDAQ